MKHKDILFILISFFVLVVAWIGFNLYHKWATSTITEDLQQQIIPIAPDFDEKALEDLKKRTKVAPMYELRKTAISPSPTTALSLSPTSEPLLSAPQSKPATPTPEQEIDSTLEQQ